MNNWTSEVNGYLSYGSRYNQDYLNPPGFKSYTQGGVNYREGVRNGQFVVDRELFENGFSCLEYIGWVNLLAAS